MEIILGLVLPHLPMIIITIIGAILAFIKGKEWIHEGFVDQLDTDVSAVVNEVYQEFVKARKTANKNGKLTEEEKKNARQLALDKLKELGAKKGKNYAQEWLVPVVLDLIERHVSRNKKES